MPYKNKVDQASASKKHYEANKASIIQRSVKQKSNKAIEFRKLVLEYKSKHPCVDCGEPDPIVLEFDHVRGEKDFNIADAVTRGYSTRKMIEEFSKCDIRCANCHRRITYNRRQQ